MAEGYATKPTVIIGNATKKSDYDNLVDFVAGGEVEDGDSGFTFVVADFGKTVRVNSGSAQTVNLPSIDGTTIGGRLGIWKLGAGNVTIQTADSDTINGGAAGGTLINSTATQTWAFVILRQVTATGWIIESGVGTWATSANEFFFGEMKLIKLDDFATPDDNTDLNASTSRHGLLKKLNNVVTNFMNGQGSWSAPVSGVQRSGATTDKALARWNGASADSIQNSTILVSNNGEMTNPNQPCFLANADTQVNVTGDGTVYTVLFANSERFDQNSDFSSPNFTAPVTGKFHFNAKLQISNIGAAHTRAIVRLVTSNVSYLLWEGNPGTLKDSEDDIVIGGSVIVDMDVSDTAYVTLTVLNSTKTIEVDESLPLVSCMFSGFLAC